MAIHAVDFDEVVAIGEVASTLPRRSDADRYVAAALGAYAADLVGDHDSRNAARPGGPDDRRTGRRAHVSDLRRPHGDPPRRRGRRSPPPTRAVEIARGRALVTTLPFALQGQARALIGRSQLDVAYAAAEGGHRLALDVGQPWAAALNLAHLGRIDALRR